MEKRVKTARRGSISGIFSQCLFIISTLRDEQVLDTSLCVDALHTCARVHVGSNYLESTPTTVGRGRTRPGRKSTKDTVSTWAWTCRLCGLVSLESPSPHTHTPLPPPLPPPLLLLPFPSSANFPYSHWSIILNKCQSFRPAVGSKQSPPVDKTVCDRDPHWLMTDRNAGLGTNLLKPGPKSSEVI